jgi:hypothetical protein
MADAAGSIATVDGETGGFRPACDKAWREWLARNSP